MKEKKNRGLKEKKNSQKKKTKEKIIKLGFNYR